MDQQRRLLLFFSIALAVMIGWSQFVLPTFFPPAPRQLADVDGAAERDARPVSALLPENARPPEVSTPPAEIAQHEPQVVRIGSPDVNSPYFLSVTLTSLGGAVEAIHLNDPRFPEFGARGTPLTLVGHDPLTPERSFATRISLIDDQLKGDTLESVHWKLEQSDDKSATFSFDAPDGQLRVVKRYSLEPVEANGQTESNDFVRDTVSKGYQLRVAVQVQNLADSSTEMRYVLRGPVGLPLEDPQNSTKFRDVRMGFLRENGGVDHSTFYAKTAVEQMVANDIEVWKRPIQYLGVDTQYFAALVHPVADQLKTPTIDSSQAIVVAQLKEPQFADVSVLMTSTTRSLAPRGSGGDGFTDEYLLYAGPKREVLLEPIKAQSVLDYGWFAPVVRIMLGILLTLHDVGLNFGLAIIGLTCLVRAAMFPLTRHQARSMDRMKELQPKIKALHEKYKKDPSSLTQDEMRQMQEVNLKMFAGCLPLFLQMPIFIALYRALQVSVDLRMAPFHLFGNWIDNLASPDMMFALGFAVPFLGWTEFNLLPFLSIALMQVNQKLTMPPPADEEQAMQYRMMNIMMLVMVVFFYRVPAGLCLYFIVSSVWGTIERLVMKRFFPAPAAAAATPVVAAAAKPAVAGEVAKPSLFGDFRAKLKELQELADKEASLRRENGPSQNGKKGPRRKR